MYGVSASKTYIPSPQVIKLEVPLSFNISMALEPLE